MLNNDVETKSIYLLMCFLIALWENLYFIFYPFKPRLWNNKVCSVK